MAGTPGEAKRWDITREYCASSLFLVSSSKGYLTTVFSYVILAQI